MAKSPFNKVNREEPLSHKIEQQIRDAIRQHIYVPGDKLPGEFEMAERFGVSRTAVREALRMLAGRGLVDIRKGSGVYVTQLDTSYVVHHLYDLLEMKCGQKSLLHIIRVRKFMEPEIARLAAKNCDEKDIQFFQENFFKMEQFAQKPDKMVEIDIQFHRRMAKATNNPIIPIIMDPIYQLLHKFITSTYKQSHAPDLALENHRQLVESIREHDAEKSFSVMLTHMMQAEKHVDQYFASIQQNDKGGIAR